MKCKHCNGTGTTNWCVNGTFVDCPYCGGTGEMEMEMTNDEWRRTCSTEEFAEFLHDVQFSCNTCTLTSFRLYKSKILKCPLQVSCAKENGVMEWLKQPHKE